MNLYILFKRNNVYTLFDKKKGNSQKLNSKLAMSNITLFLAQPSKIKINKLNKYLKKKKIKYKIKKYNKYFSIKNKILDQIQKVSFKKCLLSDECLSILRMLIN